MLYFKQHQEPEENGSPERPCQEQRAGAPAAAALPAAQQFGCPVRAVIARREGDHVKRRGVSPAEPGWHRGVAGGVLGASAPMASVTPRQIQQVRDRTPGEERVCSTGG